MVEVGRAEQESNIEVCVRRSPSQRRNEMDIHIEKTALQKIIDADLFRDLPSRGRQYIGILRIDVATGLQPAMKLAVEDQQEHVAAR